jgi:hypothetical protein
MPVPVLPRMTEFLMKSWVEPVVRTSSMPLWPKLKILQLSISTRDAAWMRTL